MDATESFFCQFCEMEFIDKQKWQEHEALEAKQFEANQKNQSALEEQTESIFCQYCDKAFTDFGEWKMHEEEEAIHFQQYEVTLQKNQENIVAQGIKDQISTENKKNEIETIFCQYCEKSFSDFDEWKIHEEAEAKIFEQKQNDDMNVDLNSQNMEINIANQMENQMDTTNNYDNNPSIPHQQNIPEILNRRPGAQIVVGGGGVPNQIKNEVKTYTTAPEQLNMSTGFSLQNMNIVNRTESLPINQENTSLPNQLLHLKGIQFTAVKSTSNAKNGPDLQNVAPTEKQKSETNNTRMRPVSLKSKYSSNIYSDQQLNILASNFERNPYLTKTTTDEISRLTGITSKSIAGWFQYQRNKNGIKNASSTNDKSISNEKSNVSGRTVAQKVKTYETLKGQIDFLLKQVSSLQKELDISRKDLTASLNDSGIGGNSSQNRSFLSNTSSRNNSLNSSSANNSLNSSMDNNPGSMQAGPNNSGSMQAGPNNSGSMQAGSNNSVPPMNGMTYNYNGIPYNNSMPYNNAMFYNGYNPYYSNHYQQFPNYQFNQQQMFNNQGIKQEDGQAGYFNPAVKQEPTF